MSQNKKDELKQAAANDGVKNPGGIAVSAFAAVYLGLLPVTSYLAKTGVMTSLVDLTARMVPGSTSERVIPALGALYVFWTFGASGAISAAGQAMGREGGLDVEHPRQHIHNLEGLPLRLRSAHYGLLENFAPFALAAALTQYLAPTDRIAVNLLGYHVLVKLFVFYPAYVFNIAPPRTLAHVSSISALINVLWRLAV